MSARPSSWSTACFWKIALAGVRYWGGKLGRNILPDCSQGFVRDWVLLDLGEGDGVHGELVENHLMGDIEQHFAGSYW